MAFPPPPLSRRILTSSQGNINQDNANINSCIAAIKRQFCREESRVNLHDDEVASTYGIFMGASRQLISGTPNKVEFNENRLINTERGVIKICKSISKIHTRIPLCPDCAR